MNFMVVISGYPYKGEEFLFHLIYDTDHLFEKVYEIIQLE